MHETVIEMPNARISRLVEGREHDPFSLLGRHRTESGWVVRTLQPHAAEAFIATPAGYQAMRCVHPAGVFEWMADDVPANWRLRLSSHGHVWEIADCWAYPPCGDEQGLYLYSEGRNYAAWRMLGALPQTRQGVQEIGRAHV